VRFTFLFLALLASCKRPPPKLVVYDAGIPARLVVAPRPDAGLPDAGAGVRAEVTRQVETTVALITEAADVAVRSTGGCDDLAVDLERFITEHGEELRQAEALREALSVEEMQALAPELGRIEAAMRPLIPLVDRCQDHPGVKRAVENLPLR
jgi:hypothetical protein